MREKRGRELPLLLANEVEAEGEGEREREAAAAGPLVPPRRPHDRSDPEKRQSERERVGRGCCR